MKQNGFIDLGVSGPDMSGTSTQVGQIIDYFKDKGLVVKDLRGGEIDALFHADLFSPLNKDYESLYQFRHDKNVPLDLKQDFFMQAHDLLSKLQVASFVKNDVSTYINPAGADVWVMEEPPKRGAGLDIRTFELNRSRYFSGHHPYAEALLFQGYRSPEFYRFRKPLRELGLITVRSRTEDSGCYQAKHAQRLPAGIDLPDYFALPGHQVAFANAPTDLFIVQAGSQWTEDEYLSLKQDRAGNRVLDDHELLVDYQLLVNERYATDWLERFYTVGCAMHNGEVPTLHRFDMYDAKRVPREPEPIRDEMYKALDTIMAREERL